jgi:hypothetical protein
LKILFSRQEAILASDKPQFLIQTRYCDKIQILRRKNDQNYIKRFFALGGGLGRPRRMASPARRREECFY